MVLLSLLWAVLNVVLLLAELASLAFVQLSAETHLYKMVQPVPERLEFHLVDNLIDKGKLKEQFLPRHLRRAAACRRGQHR